MLEPQFMRFLKFDYSSRYLTGLSLKMEIALPSPVDLARQRAPDNWIVYGNCSPCAGYFPERVVCRSKEGRFYEIQAGSELTPTISGTRQQTNWFQPLSWVRKRSSQVSRWSWNVSLPCHARAGLYPPYIHSLRIPNNGDPLAVPLRVAAWLGLEWAFAKGLQDQQQQH